MYNIRLISNNIDFYNDLHDLVSKFATDLNFTEEFADIFIIDDNLAEYNELRKKFSSVPFVFLSNKQAICSDNLNIVIKKPFHFIQLIDILRGANNRLNNTTDAYIIFNNYELRPNKKEIVDLLSNKIIKLTEKETDIIKYLYKYKNKFIEKNDLQTNVWLYNENVSTHTIETHIYRLRQKVENFTKRRLIATDNGKYKLLIEDE